MDRVIEFGRLMANGARDLVVWLGAFAQDHPWVSFAYFLTFAVLAFPTVRFALGRLIRQLGITSIKASKFEIAFDAESKKAVEQDLDQSISTIEAFRKKGSQEIARHVASLGIEATFRDEISQLFAQHFGDRYGRRNAEMPETDLSARATLHINDFVFQDRLFQLADYYPAGSGFGRTFSHRFGIIGRVWRSGIGASAGDLTHRVAEGHRKRSDEQIIQSIQREWGLTQQEAIAFKDRPSYCCVPVRKGAQMLAVLYIDAKAPNFAWPGPQIENRLDRLQKKCESALAESPLVDALIKLEDRISKTAPRLESEL